MFKKVVEGNRSSREGWFCGLPPPALATLPDGEKVHVTVESLIQEADLEFDRDGMHDRILGDSSHLKIMRHNFSNVQT